MGVSSENGQRGRKDDDFAVIGSPEHSSLCLSDVCARSLHDVQDSEMCTNPFHQRGWWDGKGGGSGRDPNPNAQQSKIRQWELVLQ